MRKLMWFAIGFAAACAAGIYLLSGAWFGLIGLFCLVGCVAMLFVQTKPAKVAAITLLGCVIGFSWLWGYDAFYLKDAKVNDGEAVQLSVTATDYSYDTDYGIAFDGRTELEGKTYRVRCYLNTADPIIPGDRVTGEFSLRYTAGGLREATYHQGKGIFLLAYQNNAVTREKGNLHIWDYSALWRQKIIHLLEGSFPADTAGFVKALLIGDSTDFTYAQDRAFQVSGLRHVVAVSGLHVSILFSLIYLAFGRNRWLNLLFGLPLLLIFAAIAGFTPSIIRACLMQALMLLSMVVNKEYDPPSALAFVVLVILGINPHAITAVSFQLSVSCMIGIFAFCEPLRQYFLSFGKLQQKSKGKSMQAKLIRWITGSVAVTLSAMVVTTPLCAIYFGMVSLVGVIANLLTLWVIAFIFYGSMLACVAMLIWSSLGKGIGWLISWPVRYVLGISGWLADFPLAAVYTDSVYIVTWIAIAYLILIVFFILKKKHPGLAAITMTATLCVCVALSWLEPRLDDTRVCVIDVGQGQSILVQQKGERYLVDCGGSHVGVTADTVANFLLSQGIFHLDGVILTHYDADHAGSVLDLLTSVDADKIYMPDITDSNGIRESIEATYPEKVALVTDAFKLELEEGNFTLYPAQSASDDNESSVCVLFQAENCDILINSDRSSAGERALLEQVTLPRLSLLVAGHHGSHTATSVDLLYATKPAAVAISVGENNPYGHPRQELLDRLSRFGCEVYRTDLQGTIIFRR